MTEDEMVGWHHRLNGHGFEWTPGVVMDREALRVVVHGVLQARILQWVARSNQSILKEINPKYSLKGLTLILKLQYFGSLM